MLLLRKVSIKYRLFINVVLLVFVSILIASAGYHGLTTINNEAESIYTDGLLPVKRIVELKNNLMSVRLNLLAMITGTEEEAQKKLHKNILTVSKEIDKVLIELIKSSEGKKKERLKKIQEVYKLFKETRDKKLIPYIFEMETDGALTLATGIQNGRYQIIDKNIKEIVKNVLINAKAQKDNVKKVYNSQLRLLWFLVVVGIIIAIIINFLIIFSIVKPIEEIIPITQKIANGDLTAVLNTTQKDEIGMLAISMQKMSDNIKKIIAGVQSSSESVASGSVQISSATEELAATIEQQSLQSGSVSTSIQELVTTSNDIAISIDETQEIANNSSKLTKDGSEKIQESIDSLKTIQGQTDNLKVIIDNLGNSTNKIGNIIEVINDVADQTNLLALNAAIEAARAGDAGRGFAVVADEVRKLAERTAKATKEIVEIIRSLQKESNMATTAMTDTAKEVDNGTKLGHKSLEILHDIVLASEKILASTSSVATAVTQENATIEEIGNNIVSIATAASESSNAVSEVAITSEDLSKQAETLITMVDKFKT